MQEPALLYTLKKEKYREMKKFYVAPEAEEVILKLAQPLLTASDPENDDITDGPTPTVENPSDDDLDW